MKKTILGAAFAGMSLALMSNTLSPSKPGLEIEAAIAAAKKHVGDNSKGGGYFANSAVLCVTIEPPEKYWEVQFMPLSENGPEAKNSLCVKVDLKGGCSFVKGGLGNQGQ